MECVVVAKIRHDWLNLHHETSRYASTKVYQNKDRIASPIKRITLPIAMEKYREIVADCCAYRKWVDEMIVEHPELFPKTIGAGYSLHDERTSRKLEDVRLRRICLTARDREGKKQVFTIAPSGVMPYLWATPRLWKRPCFCGVFMYLFGL